MDDMIDTAWNTRSDHAVQAANERKVDEHDTVPVTKYLMALDDARKSNMDAERWERIARDHQSKCESLKETNADLRRIIDDMKAATAGNGTDLSKRLREVHGLHAFAELFGFSWEDESDWDWHDVACAMADEIDATVSGYAITFAPTFDRPPETMVGETVYDSEGNAIGWIANARIEEVAE